MNSNKLLFCSVALLLPLFLLNVWLGQHLIAENSKITFLLVGLLAALSLDMLLVRIRDKAKVRQMDYEDLVAKSLTEHESNRAESPHYYSIFSVQLLIMGTLLSLAAQLNILLGVLLIGIIPVDILCRRLLHQELIIRSRTILEWQDQLACEKEIDSEPSGIPSIINEHKQEYIHNGRPPARVGKAAQIISRILLAIGTIARAVIVVLAVYDFILADFQPLFLVICAALLPMFFSNLSEAEAPALSKLDLLKSIHYVQELKEKLNPNQISNNQEVI